MKVSHDYLASAYHAGIISGFTLVSSYLKKAESSGKMVSNYSHCLNCSSFASYLIMQCYAALQVKTVIIGLGAGLLPMFLHGCFPFFDIEVISFLKGLITLCPFDCHLRDGIWLNRRLSLIL